MEGQYLAYLFRWIPDEDKLLTGDGLEGFFSMEDLMGSGQLAFSFTRTSFTSWRLGLLESRRQEERSSWTSGGRLESTRLPTQAGCSGTRPGITDS